MVKAVVLYGPPEDPDTFERYYAETHTALAKAIPGLQRRGHLNADVLPVEGPRAEGGPDSLENLRTSREQSRPRIRPGERRSQRY